MGNNIVATINTIPLAPGSIVTQGNFNATEQLLILSGGTVSIAQVFSRNFATDPSAGLSSGTGSITSTLSNGVFNLAFSMPINYTEQNFGGSNLPLTITGSLQATGQVIAVPEPASLVLCGLVAVGGLAVRRRRAAVRRKQNLK